MFAKNIRKITFAVACICLALCVSLIESKLPDPIDLCNVGDKPCLLKDINWVLLNKYQGDSEFPIRKLDPVELDLIEIKGSPGRPASLNLKFINAKIFGLKNLVAEKVSGFHKTPEGRSEILFKGPSLSLKGNYTIGGKVLILPIKGEGPCMVTMSNPKVKLTIEGASALNSNKEVYMKVKSTKLDMSIDRMVINFENLFNGDKALGENVNKFVNENWSLVWDDLKDAVLFSLNIPVFETLEKLFAVRPYSEYFNV